MMPDDRVGRQPDGISVVVPVYNEERNVKEFLQRVVPIISALAPWYEIIFALDPCTDNTATVIEHGSGMAYTVDSWFHANGEIPETVLLKDWLDGWSPAGGGPPAPERARPRPPMRSPRRRARASSRRS